MLIYSILAMYLPMIIPLLMIVFAARFREFLMTISMVVKHKAYNSTVIPGKLYNYEFLHLL